MNPFQMMFGTRSMMVLAQTEWKPGIGDPTAIGWITVGAYLVAALCCLRRAKVKSSLRKAEYGPPLVWWSLAVAMFLLAINKQLDLQSWLTIELRKLALRQGWYERRREYQVTAIACMAIFSAIGTAGLLFCLRKWWQEFWLVLFGFGLLVAFVVIRAASFHHVDIFLRNSVAGLKFNVALELSGIACIAFGAVARCKKPLGGK